MNMLDQKTLKELLDYDSQTGIFTWRSCVRYGLIGKEAGTLCKGYVVIGIKRRRYYAHRLAWLWATGEWPEYEIDHIDHEKTNNSLKNLREATRIENCRNISGLVKRQVFGVNWRNDRKKWIVRIGSRENTHWAGGFSDYFEAVCCRKSLENKFQYHGNHGGI